MRCLGTTRLVNRSLESKPPSTHSKETFFSEDCSLESRNEPRGTVHFLEEVKDCGASLVINAARILTVSMTLILPTLLIGDVFSTRGFTVLS